MAVTGWDSPVPVIQRHAHRDKGIKKRNGGGGGWVGGWVGGGREPEAELQLMNVREWQIGCYGM